MSLRLVNMLRSSALAVLISGGKESDRLYAESMPAMHRYVESFPSIMSQINFITKSQKLPLDCRRLISATVR